MLSPLFVAAAAMVYQVRRLFQTSGRHRSVAPHLSAPASAEPGIGTMARSF
jgi:hypothetical protein